MENILLALPTERCQSARAFTSPPTYMVIRNSGVSRVWQVGQVRHLKGAPLNRFVVDIPE